MGRVEASKSAVVTSPFPAKLEQVNVKQGQKVRGNGSVPEIKVVEVETALAKAQAALNSAQKAAYDCSVKASFAGTVSEVVFRPAEGGESLPVVPASVIRTDMNGRYVWTVGEDGRVEKHYFISERIYKKMFKNFF